MNSDGPLLHGFFLSVNIVRLVRSLRNMMAKPRSFKEKVLMFTSSLGAHKAAQFLMKTMFLLFAVRAIQELEIIHSWHLI